MSVTLTAAELATVISRDVSVATRLLPVVSAIVEKYAPLAPAAIQDGAAIRFAAYLANTQGLVGFRKVDIGGLNVEPLPAHGAAFYHSGAAALLARFRTHSAGLI